MGWQKKGYYTICHIIALEQRIFPLIDLKTVQSLCVFLRAGGQTGTFTSSARSRFYPARTRFPHPHIATRAISSKPPKHIVRGGRAAVRMHCITAHARHRHESGGTGGDSVHLRGMFKPGKIK